MTPHYRRARTIPELARAHCSTLGFPEIPESELPPTLREKIVGVLVGFAAAMSIGVAAGVYIAAWLSGPPAWVATALVVVAVVKGVQLPVADRIAGITRLREVDA